MADIGTVRFPFLTGQSNATVCSCIDNRSISKTGAYDLNGKGSSNWLWSIWVESGFHSLLTVQSLLQFAVCLIYPSKLQTVRCPFTIYYIPIITLILKQHKIRH